MDPIPESMPPDLAGAGAGVELMGRLAGARLGAGARLRLALGLPPPLRPRCKLKFEKLSW